MNNISDINAVRKWNSIPDDIRKKLLQNVYCRRCGVTSIAAGYSITEEKGLGILLNGKCSKCGDIVCRVIEDD
jgi:ribosomal protein S27AE